MRCEWTTDDGRCAKGGCVCAALAGDFGDVRFQPMCDGFLPDCQERIGGMSKQASWESVRDKGRAIYAAGGVEIHEETPEQIMAYVMSGVVEGEYPVTDGGPYEVILSKRSWENKGNVGGWVQGFLCDCKWGFYHSGHPGAGWQGRFCSHAYATLLAANARARSDFFGDRTASRDPFVWFHVKGDEMKRKVVGYDIGEYLRKERDPYEWHGIGSETRDYPDGGYAEIDRVNNDNEKWDYEWFSYDSSGNLLGAGVAGNADAAEKSCDSYHSASVIGKAVSAGSDRAVSKDWGDFVRQVDEMTGMTVDMAYRFYPSKWIRLYDGNGGSYEAEVEQYSDGTYELMSYNVNKVPGMKMPDIYYDDGAIVLDDEGVMLDDLYIDQHDERDAEDWVVGTLSAYDIDFDEDEVRWIVKDIYDTYGVRDIDFSGVHDAFDNVYGDGFSSRFFGASKTASYVLVDPDTDESYEIVQNSFGEYEVIDEDGYTRVFGEDEVRERGLKKMRDLDYIDYMKGKYGAKAGRVAVAPRHADIMEWIDDLELSDFETTPTRGEDSYELHRGDVSLYITCINYGLWMPQLSWPGDPNIGLMKSDEYFDNPYDALEELVDMVYSAYGKYGSRHASKLAWRDWIVSPDETHASNKWTDSDWVDYYGYAEDTGHWEISMGGSGMVLVEGDANGLWSAIAECDAHARKSGYTAGRRLEYEDDVVVVRNPDGGVDYKGIFDYCPYKEDFDNGDWMFDGEKYEDRDHPGYTLEVVASKTAGDSYKVDIYGTGAYLVAEWNAITLCRADGSSARFDDAYAGSEYKMTGNVMRELWWGGSDEEFDELQEAVWEAVNECFEWEREAYIGWEDEVYSSRRTAAHAGYDWRWDADGYYRLLSEFDDLREGQWIDIDGDWVTRVDTNLVVLSYDFDENSWSISAYDEGSNVDYRLFSEYPPTHFATPSDAIDWANDNINWIGGFRIPKLSSRKFSDLGYGASDDAVVVTSSDVQAVDGYGRPVPKCSVKIVKAHPDYAYVDYFDADPSEMLYYAYVYGSDVEGRGFYGSGVARNDELALAMACGDTGFGICIEGEVFSASRNDDDAFMKRASDWELYEENITPELRHDVLDPDEILDIYGSYKDECYRKVENGMLGVVSHYVGCVDDWWTWDTYAGFYSFGIDCGTCHSKEEGMAMCERSFADPGFTVGASRTATRKLTYDETKEFEDAVRDLVNYIRQNGLEAEYPSDYDLVFDYAVYISRRYGFDDVTDQDRFVDELIDEAMYEASMEQRTSKRSSVRQATRKFTYAEMKELEDEIEGRELHNSDRFKDGGLSYHGGF